jgi:TPP-dependent pyruvate/acetoin dehydrogenase alpha subunit
MKLKIDKTIAEKIIWLRLSQMIVNERYKKGDFKIPIHLALGHESLAVAVDRTITKDDALILSHRNIHYNLARMETLKEEMDEYYLLESGLANGHLGSMNLSNPSKNIVYTSSILGNNFSVGTGYALGNKMKNNDGIVYVITGDGAIEEGSFWESLLFLKSNNLSVIIIVENNQWSLGTKIEERRCDIFIDKIADSLGIEYISLKGNSPFEYIENISLCKENSINNKYPIIIEAHLTTLGYWYMETQGYPSGKFINYHAGPAPEIEISNYPLIVKSNEDPLYVLEEYFSKEELIDISSRMHEKIELELI